VAGLVAGAVALLRGVPVARLVPPLVLFNTPVAFAPSAKIERLREIVIEVVPLFYYYL
jgi:hypothetical protein